MKKLSVVVVTFIFIFVMASGVIPAQEKIEKKGLQDFINFLVKNKESLQYESFGSFEHEKWVEVRIYCGKETVKKLKENIGDFNYKEFSYKNGDSNTGTFFLIFQKTSGITGESSPSAAKKIKCPRKINIDVVKVKNENLNEFKYFEKGLKDGGQVSSASPKTFKVTKVFVNVGDKVEKGQILLSFDTSDIDKNISESESSLNDWKITLKKRRNWKVKSPRAEQQAENKALELEKIIEDLKEVKGMAVLASENEGQLLYISESGDTVNEGDIVAKVLNNSVLKVEITGDDVKLFEDIEKVKISFDRIERTFDGKVTEEDGKVIILINNEDFVLNSDDIAKFRMLFKVHKDVVVLDKKSLLNDEVGAYVFVVQKKRAKKVYLKTGVEENGKVIVLSGLIVDDNLIVTKDSCLKDKKKIKFNVPLPKKTVKPEKKVTKIPEKKPPKKKVEKKDTRKKEDIKVEKVKERSEWDDFEGCPSVIRVKIKKLVNENFFGYETIDSFIASGIVDSVVSMVDGSVANVFVSVGESIERGQLLLEFDVDDLETKKAEAQRSLEEWKKILTSVEEWTDRSEKLENELKEKIRKVSLLIPRLNSSILNSKVYSSSEGVVTSVAGIGDIVKEDDSLVKITDNSKVRIPLDVKDPSLYSEDMKVELGVEGLEGKFTGKITSINGKVEVLVSNVNGMLKEGMRVKVNILRTFRDVIVLSKSEFLKDSAGYFAFIVNNERAKKVYLKLGPEKLYRAMINSGLKSGDELIVSGFDCLEDNKRIKVLVYDSTRGKYVVRRKPGVIDVKREKVLKKKFIVGLGGAYNSIADQIFKDVYGPGGMGGLFDIGFVIKNKVELFANVMYMPKTGSTLSVSNVDLKMYSFYVGAKYLFSRGDKALPFLGLAMNSLAVKEKSEEIELDTVYKTSIGFSIIGGIYYEMIPGLELMVDLRYDINKMEVGGGLEDIDFSGLKAMFGIIFRF